MALLPAEWESASAALDAASTANAVEKSVKAKLETELATALRVFRAGNFTHASVSYPFRKAWAFLTVPVPDAATAGNVFSAALVNCGKHFADAEAHAVKPTPLVVPHSGDVLLLANTFKARFNQHLAVPGLHFGDPSAAALVSPDATNDASLITLAEEFRIKAPLHLKDGGQITVETTVTSSNAQAQYQAALFRYNQRNEAAAAAFAEAEPAARSAAIALGYVPSPAWGGLGYSQANVQVLRERFAVLASQPGFNSHEYCSQVAARLASNLSSASVVGSPPSPPSPSAPQTVTTSRIFGNVNPTSEAALAAVVERVNEFVTGLNAVQ